MTQSMSSWTLGTCLLCILLATTGRIQSDIRIHLLCHFQAIMHGRGRGVAGPMGRGRLMPNKQNLRVVECKPQPCVVSVEGLSSSTTDAQLKSLLMSVGPIQVGCLQVVMMPVSHLSRYNYCVIREHSGPLWVPF